MKEIIDNIFKSHDDLLIKEGKDAGTFLDPPAQKYIQRDIIEHLFKNHEGNVLEIGAHRGNTTLCLLEVAEKYGRKVYVIDPWNGAQQGNSGIYQEFMVNTKEYQDKGTLEIVKLRSQDIEAIGKMSGMNLIYAFVDGLHQYSAVKQDLENVHRVIGDGGIVCLDDTGTAFNGQITKAMNEAIDDKKFTLYPKPTTLAQRDFEILLKA